MSGPHSHYSDTTAAFEAGYSIAMSRARVALALTEADRDAARAEAMRWAERMQALEARIDRARTALEGGEG